MIRSGAELAYGNRIWDKLEISTAEYKEKLRILCALSSKVVL